MRESPVDFRVGHGPKPTEWGGEEIARGAGGQVLLILRGFSRNAKWDSEASSGECRRNLRRSEKSKTLRVVPAN